MQNIFRFLGSRLFRNLIFWMFAASMIINNRQKGYPYSSMSYYVYIAMSSAIILTLTYFNNLFLVPRLLVRKKYFQYFGVALVMLATLATIQTVTIKQALQHFPVLKVQQVSFISVPITNSWTWNSMSEEISSYFFGFGLWVFIFTMAWYMNDYSRQQKISQQAVKKQVEAELSFLKDQLNPHFLLNTLNNMYGLALMKSDKTPEAILQLSSILRYFLYESNVGMISFDKEKKLMQAYIELELLRLSDRAHLTFFMDADNAYHIPPLLWLPILENVFKHGTRYIADEYYIEYKFVIYNNVLSISSKNGYKHGAVKDNEGGGIGLTNLKKRLEILFPGKHTVDTSADESTYCINIDIQLARP